MRLPCGKGQHRVDEGTSPGGWAPPGPLIERPRSVLVIYLQEDQLTAAVVIGQNICSSGSSAGNSVIVQFTSGIPYKSHYVHFMANPVYLGKSYFSLAICNFDWALPEEKPAGILGLCFFKLKTTKNSRERIN